MSYNLRARRSATYTCCPRTCPHRPGASVFDEQLSKPADLGAPVRLLAQWLPSHNAGTESDGPPEFGRRCDAVLPAPPRLGRHLIDGSRLHLQRHHLPSRRLVGIRAELQGRAAAERNAHDGFEARDVAMPAQGRSWYVLGDERMPEIFRRASQPPGLRSGAESVASSKRDLCAERQKPSGPPTLATKNGSTRGTTVEGTAALPLRRLRWHQGRALVSD